MEMEGNTTEGQGSTASQGVGPSDGQGGREGEVALSVASEGFARIVADSISPQGIRITTFHLRYWRAIHAELMTHRVFSRNARSSRAVPSKVLLTEPIFIPVFGMNKPGMQSDITAPEELQMKWRNEWQDLAAVCRDYVERWSGEGMHKQHANRPLEWFGWIDVLVTSTYWENFWTLRISEYAQPEFDELAKQMKYQMRWCSTPRLLQPGEWHLPYITGEERNSEYPIPLEDLLKISTARCARLSYKPFDGNADYDAEVSRYEKLVVSSPVHASPAEHQATPDTFTHTLGGGWDHPGQHGNFLGWRQHRKMIPGEAIMETTR
jgi:hypothetical protein